MSGIIISCLSDLTAEALGSSGVAVFFGNPIVSDNISDLYCVPASGSIFPLGNTVVTCVAINTSDQSDICTFNIKVVDTTKPAINCSSDIIGVEATGPGGANVNYSAPIASDSVGIASVACLPASGSLFPLGNTVVTCKAVDTSGNSDICKFNIKVVDTTKPTIKCSSDIIGVEATGPGGANVTYSAPVASDSVGIASVTCLPASGSLFSLGNTVVTCKAVDTSGNSDVCSFNIKVVDTTKPTIKCSSDIIGVEATGPGGANVNYSALIASDSVGIASVACLPASGSLFPLGNTVVTCKAVDTSGNSDVCSFNIKVVDTTKPTIKCSSDIIGVEATGPGGANVTYTVKASDIVGISDLSCFPPSGSLFPLGNTVVTCKAVDTSGNSDVCSFNIKVVDTIRPIIKCSSDIIGVEATHPEGAVVNYTIQFVSDIVQISDYFCTPVSGIFYPLGNTIVTCKAIDTSGNSDVCQFKINVVDTTPPAITFSHSSGNQIVVEATGPGGVLVAPNIVAHDLVDLEPVIVCTTDKGVNVGCGTRFPIGITSVTCTATDFTGNQSKVTFTVNVVDTTPPTVTCPKNITVETSNRDGIAIPFQPLAKDIVDMRPTITCFANNKVVKSGDKFPIGQTRVCCFPKDAAGNVGNSCCFYITVKEKQTPPSCC